MTASSAFALPARLAAKSDPALVADDEAFFSSLTSALDGRRRDLADRLDTARRAEGGAGRQALDRDLDVHRTTARLRLLRRFGIDLCLGRMVTTEGERLYVGRLGLTGPDGARLLVDWRAPAAEPFFAATQADPMGLVSRRRYRWSADRVVDFWDEVLDPDGLDGPAALDDASAFVASLGAARDGRMRDVLATIAADQDAVVRADARGALVVDGGPGTGKTVVALHRAAYLLHADRRLREGHGGVLVVGPHEPYLAYVADVLPSLGEEEVRTCTLRDLVPEGRAAVPDPDPRVAALKADVRMPDAVDPAVALYEEPPTESLEVETPWGGVTVEPEDWTRAFDTPEPGTPHNEARDVVWEALVALLAAKARDEEDEEDETTLDDDEFDAYGLDGDPDEDLRRVLAADRELTTTFARAWPLLDPAEVVADLWSVPAYLRRCAPWLSPEEVRLLRRSGPHAWTTADLPVLDAARRRVGDPQAAARRRRMAAAERAERARMADVVADLVASDDSEMGVMSMLRGQDLRAALVDPDALGRLDPDVLAGPFAHVVVDEAQELTDAQWRMVLDRCPSRSLTVVGDRAQARHGFPESWQERLARVGVRTVRQAELTVNYRTPEEVMAAAEPVIRGALPDANVPTSVRRSGIPVTYGDPGMLDDVLDGWLAEHPEGTACVVGAQAVPPRDRVVALDPAHVKGLEFDLVVLVEPHRFGAGVEGAVDRYVAMTRATERLVVLGSRDAAVASSVTP